jgi:hypothetical protein
MFRPLLIALAAVSMIGTAGAQTAPSPAPAPTRVDAREQIPPALIGAWKFSPTESKFAPGKAPKMQYRIFSYTADGMLLVDYLTLGANGTMSAGNWTSSFDGTPRVEYMRVYGSTPYAMVVLTMKDARTFDLTAAKHGNVFETGQFVLAPDGQTLTFTYQAGGATSVAVYHPWNLVN